MDDPPRRPIKSRDTALARRAARWLARSRVTPNQISAASIGFAALASGTFWLASLAPDPARSLCLIAAALGIQLRLLCNLFDGMVAVEGDRQSATGAFWNEAPDRAADILILVGMGLGAGAVALGWAAAAFAVLTAYIRELGASVGCAPDFHGPMAKPHRMAAATLAALVAVGLPWVGLDWNALAIGLWVIVVGSGATALRRSARLLRALQQSDPPQDRSSRP